MTKVIKKIMTCVTAGSILTMLELVFGKMDYSITFLFICMGTDFITGVWCGCVNKELNSRTCVNGLFRKLMILVYVMLAHHMDVLLDKDYIRVGVCYMYMVSEMISIFENGVKLGVPVPEPIRKALELLNNKKEQ